MIINKKSKKDIQKFARPGQRSDVTTQIVKSVALGNGKIIDSQKAVGGYPKCAPTKRSLNVPNGAAARRAWLDKLEDDLAVDTNIDLSQLYGRVGSRASDKLS